MFPTFISFTNRHPRFATLIGLTLFILVALLWVTVNQQPAPSEVVPPIVQEETVNQEELDYQEKMRVLEELKSDEAESIPEEEKMKVLEELKSDTVDEISPEEKMQILESLQ